MSDLHFPDCQGKAWETRTHLEKAGEKLWTFLLWSNWKLPHSWEAEAGPDGTDSAQAHLPTWDQSHIYMVSENCAWACFTWPGKSIDVFEAKLSSPFGHWHSSWKIALTISIFTLTNGNLSDGNFPNTDTCCVFKNLDQLLCMSYLGGFMLTDKKFGFCHASPQGFP